VTGVRSADGVAATVGVDDVESLVVAEAQPAATKIKRAAGTPNAMAPNRR